MTERELHYKIGEDATKIASLTSVKRVRYQDEARIANATNGGEHRLAKRLSSIVRRLEQSIS